MHSVAGRAEEDGIPMTPVPSPLPQDGFKDRGNGLEPVLRPEIPYSREGPDKTADKGDVELVDAQNKGQGPAYTARFYGSLINPFKQSPEKARFKKDLWKNVQVGDFVRIYNDDPIPADIVILSTSDPDGACYVETKNLDGETNLKVRQALHSGRAIKHARDCERSEFLIESEPAHANLYQYSGVARWKQKFPEKPDDDGTPMAERISIDNVLLRS